MTQQELHAKFFAAALSGVLTGGFWSEEEEIPKHAMKFADAALVAFNKRWEKE